MENSKALYQAQSILDGFNFLEFEVSRKASLVSVNLIREIYYYESDFWDDVKEIIEHGTINDLYPST